MSRHPFGRSLLVLLTIGLFFALAGTAGATAVLPDTQTTVETQTEIHSATTQGLADSHVAACAAESPADHDDPDGGTTDVIGWVDGYWYDKPVDIDDPQSLTREEIEELTARTAARVETLRCQPFKEVPPVDIVSREEFGDRIAGDLDDFFTPDHEQALNAQYAAMLVAGQDTDAAALFEEHRTGFAAAFYSPADESIGFVADSPEDTDIDQVTLAHELQHALQDQYYDLAAYNQGETTDQLNANLSVVEGEAQFIDHQYEKNCEQGAWVDDCIRNEAGDPPEPADWQLTLWDLQPYTDGYTLVETQYESEGWDGVDALFEDVPTSTLHSIDPPLYGEVEPKELAVPDESTDEWQRITLGEGSDAERIGPAGLSAMLMGVGYETQFQESVIGQFDILQEHERDYVNYDHPETDGWRGDRLYTYHDGSDTAAVWKLAWIDGDEAERFADAYGELAEIRGAEAHDTYDNVYTFDDADGWDMAVALDVRDDRLWIVTAPTVDALAAVHGDLELTESTDDATDGTADDDGAGFGVAVALVAVSGAVILVCRTRKRRRVGR